MPVDEEKIHSELYERMMEMRQVLADLDVNVLNIVLCVGYEDGGETYGGMAAHPPEQRGENAALLLETALMMKLRDSEVVVMSLSDLLNEVGGIIENVAPVEKKDLL